MEVYTVTFNVPRGGIKTVGFMGSSQKDVLYAALETFPDWSVVRITRDVDWPADCDGETAAGSQPRHYG